jgi:RNA polymerase sigma factor (sigma-70 family)
MSADRLSGVRGYLRELAGRHQAEGQTDGELLDRFARRGDEAAFASLLGRYGQLVWGVCRRVLRDEHDAEDAFQATFLVLARSAGSVRNRASVRAWLHGVALKVAVRARARRSRWQALERPVVEVAVRDTAPAIAGELGSILDEEIRRLPEKYRAPVILCYLEGLSGEEAAQQLGCPRATLATRLARARQRLQGRLRRRGLGVPEGAFVLTPPAALLQTTANLTSGAIPPAVLTLTKEVLRGMFVSKVKTWTAGLLVALLLGGGAVAYQLTAAPPSEKKEAPPAAARGHDQAVAKLVKKKFELASEGLKAARQEHLAGRTIGEVLYDWSKRCLDAERELNNTPAGQKAALKAHLERMKEYEMINQARYQAGRIPVREALHAKFARVEAELWLARHQGKK